MPVCGNMRFKDGPGAVPPLGCLYINPTRYCNLSCRHCWLAPPVKDEARAGASDEMTAAEMIAIVKEGRKLGLGYIKITGGEPLLSKELWPLLEFCRSKGVGTIMETNGTLIDGKTAGLLAKYRVGHVSVSIDSASAELNDRLRGRKGAYRLAMRGIRNLIAENFSPQIIFSIYRENIKEVGIFLKLMEKTGIKDVKLNTISPVGRGRRLQEKGMTPSLEELLDLAERAREERKSFRGSLYLDMPIAFKSIEEIRSDACKKCAVKNILGILSDGKVSLCGIGYMEGSLVFGGLKEDPSRLRDIWTRDRFLLALREGLPAKLKGICGICVFKRTCMGNCRAEVYHNTGDIFAPHWFCQEAYKKGLFPKTRMIPKELRPRKCVSIA